MPFSHSLKDKRNVLTKIKDRARSAYDVRISEVGGQDTWQSAVLGFAVVGTDRRGLEGLTEKVVRFVEDTAGGDLLADDREVLFFGDESAARFDGGEAMTHE